MCLALSDGLSTLFKLRRVGSTSQPNSSFPPTTPQSCPFFTRLTEAWIHPTVASELTGLKTQVPPNPQS